MPIIVVQPGDILKVQFANEEGSPQDGEFEVHFDSKKHPHSLIIKETAGLPGNVIGDARSILYEKFFEEVCSFEKTEKKFT